MLAYRTSHGVPRRGKEEIDGGLRISLTLQDGERLLWTITQETQNFSLKYFSFSDLQSKEAFRCR